ncbi:hypothetical protein AYR62_06775 [Secundilactobacillus paracollinoides]|uniref:Uncharacterized protein n=1 Tax=Secundilactobacillus paracollinoides TaxID=240427 RepID=A0A1B2J1F2_9LACO|nr:hypothetical protein [Secundilactobacillus paracollinoides]ANZ62133.1 hypothetical protein AYR61_12790 [Secundilactobacillus paracollinoides]ANZ63822.1 hypothetical protein AYR62_06775 [Secundilactobacillus paracollinoides]ANZ68080.1 hypothetical protein AYR63_13665 [Secundilactobacillus paracollinoides]KRL76444.1 hypothetical protein FC17_GL001947 [Secundilactobacillus paracollinoides DSM 15502 = JCM 11969]
MTNETSALKKLSTQLNAGYRQLLALDQPSAMPTQQRQYFIDQAITRHYHVQLTLTGDPESTMTGYLKRGPKNTVLVTIPHDTMTSIAHLNQISFISRLDY